MKAARDKQRIEDLVIALALRFIAAFPVAWGLSMLLDHGGTYWPSVLLVFGMRGAVYRENS